MLSTNDQDAQEGRGAEIREEPDLAELGADYGENDATG
jgi:hypothetical protein